MFALSSRSKHCGAMTHDLSYLSLNIIFGLFISFGVTLWAPHSCWNETHFQRTCCYLTNHIHREIGRDIRYITVPIIILLALDRFKWQKLGRCFWKWNAWCVGWNEEKTHIHLKSSPFTGQIVRFLSSFSFVIYKQMRSQS